MIHSTTWLVSAALAVNYGARGMTPVVAHVLCQTAGCDAALLVGSVASAFFMGDLIAQLVAKSWIRQLGGKQLLLIGMLGLSLLTFAIAASLPGPLSILLGLQAAFGFCCGFGYPAAHALIATVPASQRSTAVSLFSSAGSAGTMLSSFLTPLMVHYLGWLSPFFAFSSLNLVLLFLVWRFIPQATIDATSAAPKEASDLGELRRWVAMPLVKALLFGMYAVGVAFTFLYSFIPTFFVEVYDVKVSDLGWITSAAPLLNAVICVLGGLLVDFLSKHGWLTQHCRMLMQSLGTALPAMSIFMLCTVKNTTVAAVLVTIWFASHGFQTSGLTATFHDAAKVRASELWAVGNTLAKLAGIFAGSGFSWMARVWGWNTVLVLIACHYIASGVVLVSFMDQVEHVRHVIAPDGELSQPEGRGSTEESTSSEDEKLSENSKLSTASTTASAQVRFRAQKSKPS